MGAQLNQVELDLEAFSGTDVDVNFEVEGTIQEVSNVLSGEGNSDNLNRAENVEVQGGTGDVSEAALIQNVTNYDSSDSFYTISDSSSSILSDTGTILNQGVDYVEVEDTVDAATGLQLNDLESQKSNMAFTGSTGDADYSSPGAIS